MPPGDPEPVWRFCGPPVTSTALWAMESTGIGWCCNPTCDRPFDHDAMAVSYATGLFHPECFDEDAERAANDADMRAAGAADAALDAADWDAA